MSKASREASQHLKHLEAAAKLQKEISSDASAYLNAVKEIGVVQEALNDLLVTEATLTDEIATMKARLASLAHGDPNRKALKKDLEYTIELRKQTREAAHAANQHLTTLQKTVKSANLANIAYVSAGKVWAKLPDLAQQFYGWLKSLEALDMSKDIKQAELSMGILSNQSKFFSKTISKASESTIQLGFGIKDIAKAQAEYSESIGRSMMLSEGGYVAMAEMAKGTTLGAEGAAAMAASMENFGISVEGSRDMVQETLDASQKMGSNSSKTIKELTNALKLGQKYHFKGGVKGMASMAAYAAKMGIDMNDIANMAEKAFRPEEAVEMAAKMATLGGSFARLGDPFSLMFKARNDIEGFTKDIGNAASEFAQFNSATGEFDITGLQLDRMRELSKVTGMSVDELSQLAKKSAQFKKIDTLIPSVIADEDKDIINSLANFDKDSGQWEVTMNGETKYLKDLEQADLIKYKREQQSLKDRALQAQTFDDAFNNLVMQFKSTLLPFVEQLNEYFVPALKDFQQRLIDEGWIDKLKSVAADIGSFVVGIGKFAATIVDTLGVGGTVVAGALITVFFKAAQWYANGLMLAKGFNSLANAGGGASGGDSMADGLFGKKRGLKGGLGRLTKAGKGGGVKGVGKAATRMLKSGLKGNAVTALVMGGVDAATNLAEGQDATQAIGRALITSVGSLVGGALGTLVAPGAGTVAGGIGGGMLGGSVGDAIWGEQPEEMNDGVIKFNPQDKFLKMNDGLVASTDKGKIDDLVGGKGGKTKVEFGELKISGEITLKNNNGSTVEVDILRDPFFIKEMTKLIQQQLSMNIGGGKLNPNPA